MTKERFDEAARLLAQGAVNIAEGEETIEFDSAIYQAMADLALAIQRGEVVLAETR